VRKIQPGWKLWLIMLSIVVLGAIVSVEVSIKIGQHSIREQLRIQCGTNAAVIQAYEETPPSTPAGRNVRQAYIDQYRLLGCPPRD
jgi:hypothetical protein